MMVRAARVMATPTKRTRAVGDKEGGARASRVMATAPKREVAAATRAAGEEEGDGESGESDGDAYKAAGDKEGGARAARVMATPTERAMAAATRAAGDEEGDVEGGESDGDGDKEGDSEKEGEALICRHCWTVSLLVTCSPSSSDSRPPSAPSWPLRLPDKLTQSFPVTS